MRFKTGTAVRLLEAAFDQAVARWRDGAVARLKRIRHPLLRRFTDVVVWDATVITIANALRSCFGVSRGGSAAMKLFLGISVFGKLPLCAQIDRGPAADCHRLPPLEKLRKGSLLLLDRGFLSTDNILRLGRGGFFYLCPAKSSANALVFAINRAPAWFREEFRKRPPGSLELRRVLGKSERIREPLDLEVVVAKHLLPAQRISGAACTRLVILPGRRGKQLLYLTNVSAKTLSHEFLRETYRLRWQVELVFKELKQHLNLESVPTKDRYAAQVFAWASLIALAVSRQVLEWLEPTCNAAGLAAALRPMLLSRALVGTIRLLAKLLHGPPTFARHFEPLLYNELRQDALRPPGRMDSFARLALALTP